MTWEEVDVFQTTHADALKNNTPVAVLLKVVGEERWYFGFSFEQERGLNSLTWKDSPHGICDLTITNIDAIVRIVLMSTDKINVLLNNEDGAGVFPGILSF